MRELGRAKRFFASPADSSSAAIDAAWVRVEDFPEEWKDGRELLVYFFDDEFVRPMQVPAFWDGDSEEWIDPFVADVITFDVTHVRLLPEGPK